MSAIYVSSYCYVCVLIRFVCVLILLYVSAYCYMCVRVLLHVCPHTKHMCPLLECVCVGGGKRLSSNEAKAHFTV